MYVTIKETNNKASKDKVKYHQVIKKMETISSYNISKDTSSKNWINVKTYSKKKKETNSDQVHKIEKLLDDRKSKVIWELLVKW